MVHLCADVHVFICVLRSNTLYMAAIYLTSFSPSSSVVENCGGTLSSSSGVITSPLHPSFYPPAIDCSWTIKVCNAAPFTGGHPPPFSPHAPLHLL